jgi:hypothetical protein
MEEPITIKEDNEPIESFITVTVSQKDWARYTLRAKIGIFFARLLGIVKLIKTPTTTK